MTGLRIGRGIVHRFEEDHVLGSETKKWKEELGEKFSVSNNVEELDVIHNGLKSLNQCNGESE